MTDPTPPADPGDEHADVINADSDVIDPDEFDDADEGEG